MEKLEIFCQECDAVYAVEHDLDIPYEVKFCKFCGEELDTDDMDWGEENEEE